MELTLIPLYYFTIGIAFFFLVYFFNDQYRSALKRALLVIKTAGIKAKQTQSEMERKRLKKIEDPKQAQVDSAEIQAEQKAYSEEVDHKIEQKYEEIKENPQKASRALFGLIIAWPLVAFLIVLAGFLSSVYLTEAELLNLESQL